MFGQLLTQHIATGRRIDHARHDIALSVHFFNARLDFGVQGQSVIIQSQFQFRQIANHHAFARQSVAL